VVALVVSTVALFAGIALVFAVGRRRPPGTPVTWGEAFVGGTFIFALLLLGYGIVPHQWLTFADNDLLWRPDKLMLGISGDGVKLGNAASDMGGTGRIIVNAQAVRDIVAATIYIVFLVIQVWLWSVWQKRGRKAPEVELSSRFGRPVMRKA
jgi:hypothetical protein